VTAVEIFLAGARAVLGAVGDPAVATAWDAPSVLEGQTVGGLVGHLARGSVWVVGDYLDGEEPAGPATVHSAAAYYAGGVARLTEADHAGIRERGARVGAMGHAALVRTLNERLRQLEQLLTAVDPARRVSVFAGRVMRLDHYLDTRVVEQVVHLEDLAESLNVSNWSLPVECVSRALEVGVELGRLRFGDRAMVRALFRETGSSVLPVL
jgi:hypothetical protein